LRSLILRTLNFTDAVPGSGVLYDLILNTVQWRKVNKTPLTTLWITNCVISADEAGKFRSVARNFYWDNEEDPRRSLTASMRAAAFDDFAILYEAESDSSASD